jgi:hypothetical protein
MEIDDNPNRTQTSLGALTRAEFATRPCDGRDQNGLTMNEDAGEGHRLCESSSILPQRMH